MRITVNDVKYELDIEKLKISEMRWLERKVGMSMKDFYDGLSEDGMRADSVAALVWFALERAGETMPDSFEELDFPVFEVMGSIELDEDTEPPDPTVAADVSGGLSLSD